MIWPAKRKRGSAFSRNLLVEQLGLFKKRIAVQPAKPRERSAFKTGDHAKDTRLLAVLELGLKPDHVPKRSERVVLPELDHGMRGMAGARVGQSDRLHGTEP